MLKRTLLCAALSAPLCVYAANSHDCRDWSSRRNRKLLRHKSEQCPKDGCFFGAVGAHDSRDFARVKCQRDILFDRGAVSSSESGEIVMLAGVNHAP
jgi:hypothetical protein